MTHTHRDRISSEEFFSGGAYPLPPGDAASLPLQQSSYFQDTPTYLEEGPNTYKSVVGFPAR